MVCSQQRLPRFTRDPDAAGPFHFTKRDLEILRHVAEHRFIRSNWLIKLVSGSQQQLLRRLNLLYHHGYLERPRCQIDYYHKGGSQNIAYGLASRGAGRLRHDLDLPFNRMDWTIRNKRVGRIFLEHTLMVSNFMAAMELDCRQRKDTRLLYSHQMLGPEGDQERLQLSRWSVQVSGRRRVYIVPDKVFALEISRPDQSIKRIPYFVEADSGSMPIERRDPRQSSIAGKLKAYQETYRKHVLRTRLGTRFRVLIIVNTIERCNSINALIVKTVSTRDIFLVMSEQQLQACKCRADEITTASDPTLLGR